MLDSLSGGQSPAHRCGCIVKPDYGDYPDARLAWKLLETQGLTTAPKAGPTDIHGLLRREELDRRKREIDGRKERRDVVMDDMFTLDGM